MTVKVWFPNFTKWAIFIWIVALAVSVAILFLGMTGVLSIALPEQSQRNPLLVVTSQIITVLFTVMRLHHLFLLWRWNSDDISELRQLYCKNGTYKPHERALLLVVILLHNLSCFAQHAFCGLIIGYKQSDPPAIALAITIAAGLGSAAIAVVFSVVGPLGKEGDITVDEEAQALRHSLTQN